MSGPKDKYEGILGDLPGPRKRRKKAVKRKTARSSTPIVKKTTKKAAAKKPPKKKTTRRSTKSRPAAPKPKPGPAPTDRTIDEHVSKPRAGKRKPTRSEVAPLLPHTGMAFDETTMFTVDRQATVLALIQDGAAQAYAAHIAGVGRRTLQQWLRKGRRNRDEYEAWKVRLEDGETRDDLTEEMGHLPELDDYARFAQLYERAEAESVCDVASCILIRALARDGFVIGGTVVEVTEKGTGKQKSVTRTTTSIKNGTIECAMWWLERRDNRMFGKGAQRPRDDDERNDDGTRTDPVGELFEHVCRFFDQSPSEG